MVTCPGRYYYYYYCYIIIIIVVVVVVITIISVVNVAMLEYYWQHFPVLLLSSDTGNVVLSH